MRVSKETAVLLKDAGYDGTFKSIDIDENGNTLYLPTLHEAADWLRSKGVHVYAAPNLDYASSRWIYQVSSLLGEDSILINSFLGYPSHDLAYEAGIVHGLKYIIH